MDKIILSPKFKKLKLNFDRNQKLKGGTTRFKPLKNVSKPENSNHKTPMIRESPRRRQHMKEFNVKDLQCSLTSNNVSDKQSQIQNHKPSLKVLDGSNGFQRRRETFPVKNDVPVNKNISETLNGLQKTNITKNMNSTNAINSIRYERDSSGFLKPIHPVRKRNYVEEEIKRLNERRKKLFDSNLLDEVEIAYLLEKLTNFSRIKSIKFLRNEQSLADCSRPDMPVSSNHKFGDRISAWIQSCQLKNPSLMTGTTGIVRLQNLTNPTASSVAESINERLSENSQKNTFMLKNWSVIKGSGEAELMVSGTLIDIRNRKVIEVSHKSSTIQESTAHNCVSTVCCVYKLCGNFVGGDDMPLEIKKNFMNGKFPDSWRKIASNWHSMNKKRASSSIRRSLQYAQKSFNKELS